MFKEISKKKTLMFLFMLLVAGVSSANLATSEHKDPNCNEYDATGACTRCAYRYYMNKDTMLCAQVSDLCETWD